jgi:perosamine synthetase
MAMRHISLGHLSVNEQGRKYVNSVLDSNRLSKGKYTDKFEKDFASFHQVKHSVFCNSGTSALQVALAALAEYHKYPAAAEVLVPATTFIATSNIVLHNGMKPIFVDVDPITFNLDPSQIERHITPRTRAIIPVHLFGLPADMVKIKAIADKHNLQIIEDSCETMFAKCYGKSVGSWGDVACFSTYIAHLITGGVGGLVITDNPELMRISRSLIAHGRDSIYTSIDDDSDPTKTIIERRFRFERVGYSYRVTELEAAIALSELEQWESNISARRRNAATLTGRLSDIGELQLPSIPLGFEHSFMMYPMVLKEGSRDRLLMHLEENLIETRYLFPLLTQPVYRHLFPGLDIDYPTAKYLGEQGFFIGIHQGLNEDDVKYVSDVIHDFFGVYL